MERQYLDVIPQNEDQTDKKETISANVRNVHGKPVEQRDEDLRANRRGYQAPYGRGLFEPGAEQATSRPRDNSQGGGGMLFATWMKDHINSTRPVLCARVCRASTLSEKDRRAVTRAKTMYAMTMSSVGTTMRISGIANGVHCASGPFNSCARALDQKPYIT